MWMLIICVHAETDPWHFLFQISKKDFEGFKNLFHRFLQVKGPSVKWDKIHKPPEDLVSS